MIRRRTPLRSSAPLRRLTPLAPRSRKRIAADRKRTSVREEVLARDGGCIMRGISSRLCSGPLDVDEIVSRGRGGSALDPDNCQTLCRAHHDAKHSHIHAASILGLWGSAAMELHTSQELGPSASIQDRLDLGVWALDVFDARKESP